MVTGVATSASISRATRMPQWMTTDLKEIGSPKDAVAGYVKDAGSGVVIANHNAATPFKPAWILTTFATLDISVSSIAGVRLST